MKLVRSARLWMKEGTSDKVYEIDIVDLEQNQEQYLVNFRYGRRGQSLRDGTKTKSPVTLQAAVEIFDSLVIEKVNRGYRRIDTEAASSSATTFTAASAEGREAELLARLETCVRSPWPTQNLDRLFWRTGVVRIEAAYSLLAAFAEKTGTAEASYSLVYALARCGGGQAADLLARIASDATSPVTRDYAQYARASALMGERKVHTAALPDAPDFESAERIRQAIATNEGAFLVAALDEINKGHANFANGYLIALAHVCLEKPELRGILLSALSVLPARPPYMKVLRRLFKYADLTDDGPLFAATARRLELASAMYNRRSAHTNYMFISGKFVRMNLDEELQSPTPKIAFSRQTRLYFKRRSWRLLRKRAELGHDAYTAMATELLLSFSDQDCSEPRQWSEYVYNNGSRQELTYSTDGFSHIWSAGHVLYGEAPGAQFKETNLTLRHLGKISTDIRNEAFAHLWDQQPALLLRIAAQARNRPSALFAITALKNGPACPVELEIAAIGGLVTSPYQEVADFAETVARRLIDRGEVDCALLTALLKAAQPSLQKLAIEAINTSPAALWADPVLALAVITNPHEAIHKLVQTWLSEHFPAHEQRDHIIQALADWLGRLPQTPDETQRSGLSFAVSLLPALWPNHDCSLNIRVIEALTCHKAVEVKAAAIELLAVTQIRPEDLPASFWQPILESDEPEIRTASMRLISRLEDAALLQKAGIVLAAALSEHAALRHAACPLMARICRLDGNFSAHIRDRLMEILFQAEPVEGHAADMVRLYNEALPPALAEVDTGTLWRLLKARAKGARLLGSSLLAHSDPALLSVRQIARLGNHSFVSVRQWVMRVFHDSQSRFRAEPEQAVLLAESEWDDVRLPATRCFLEWPTGLLPVSALAVMADSTLVSVQDCARQLLRARIQNEDASIILGRILEHPSSSFHLFATELLTVDVLADSSLFSRFLTQARIILMQINRGRVAKDRIFTTLRKQALADRERAAAIQQLMCDLTLSIVSRDRVPALMLLRDIAQAWPDMTIPANFQYSGAAGLRPQIRSAS